MTATSSEAQHEVDVCVVGGGQAALVLGFYLRREAERAGERPERLSLVLLDDRPEPGGAWVDAWTHLSLFSPAAYSSLAGRPMPGREGTPSASDVVAYLRDYEQRYDLPVRRPVRVRAVRPGPGDRLDVVTDHGRWRARAVVTATGTWSRPLWPAVPGADHFGGAQLHAASYRDPAEVPGDRVLVVGGGNSGAQVAADLRLHTGKEVTWVTRRPPRFLPDDVDGRVLFEVATRAVADRAAGREAAGVGGLGDVVAVPEVREARDRCGLRAEPMPLRLEPGGAVWPDGTRRAFDAVLWCTGFRPALAHLRSLRLPRRGGVPEVRPPKEGSLAAVSAADPRVWFLGLGEWCAPASATLIGVNRPARDTARALRSALLGGG